MEKVDITVVGAGVVGLALAARLTRAGRTVVVLEAHPRYGVETSSRNSEVLHAGIYYPPDSLKSRLCHEGRRRIYALAEGAGLFARKTGKLIVAVDSEEAARIEEIKERAERSGAEGLRIVDGAAVRKRVPYVRAAAALWCPESGIVDSEALMRYFHQRACDRGAIFLFGSALRKVERGGGGYILTFGKDAETLSTPLVINAAGLHADKVAAMAGIDPDKADCRLHWCKGSYFRCKGEAPLPHLVYPLPRRHGLGIHLTMDREGRIRLGPDTRFVDRLDYDVDPSLGETFLAAVRRYWPELAGGSLIPDTAGIRPKLSGPGGGFRDFIVREEANRGRPGWINLIGIESPGLTASPAIAEHVAAMVE